MTAVAMVVVLAGAAVGARWFFNRPENTVDAAAAAESATVLATNALGTAREAAVFFRDSAKRDIANLSTLLKQAAEEDEEEAVEEGDEAPDAKGAAAAVSAPPAVGPTVNELMEGAAGPELSRQVESFASAAVPTEPPLFMVFDEHHTDVIPPGTDAIRMQSDQFSDMWITDVPTENSGVVEVVVAETGYVESAKMISAPRNVHEWMFLSAVKAWRFYPAEKDGQAVRYRQRLQIAVAR